MPDAAYLLAQSLAKFRNANRIDGTRASYRKDNPAEYAKVIAYLDGSTRPTGVTSEMGVAFLLEEDARRALGVVEPPPPPPAGDRLWAADSPINAPISASPQVILGYGQGVFSGLPGVGLNGGGWGVGIFRDASGSRRTLFNGTWYLANVPKPAQWQAYYDGMAALGDTEKHAVIYDGERVHNVYGGTRDFTRCGAMGELRAAGSGFWHNPTGPWLGRASGFCSAVGAVLKKELDAGVIEHALAVGWPKARIKGDAGGARPGSFVAPATSSDGSGLDAGLPMGTLLQLDPSLTDAQILGFGISAYYLPLAKAMQSYGAYIADSTSWMTIYAESWNDAGRIPWTSGWHPGSLKLVPYLRAVAGPPAPEYDSRLIFNQPHK